MKTLAVILLLAAAPALAQQPASQPQTPVIVTGGDGVITRAPDRAWVSIAAESRAKTAVDAQRMNADAMRAVLDRVKAAGIPADAIQTTGYSLQPEFDYANGRQTLRDYVARNQVQVKIDALARTGDVIAAAVATGATSVSNVRFDLKDRDAAEKEALRLAVRDARGRADAAAEGAGVAIGGVQRIDEQRDAPPVVRPAANFAAMRADAAPAPLPVEAGEIEIRAHVTMVVWLK
ncbi:MAG TPA: SIMPL domain-containing protein [Vicinamibacterales bacterium]|jgi:hypothetical protein